MTERWRRFTDEDGGAIIVTPPICELCRHLHRETGGYVDCDAFPDGIPVAILAGDHDHTTPFPGDHGIHFAPV
jgi:hypothetical protein